MILITVRKDRSLSIQWKAGCIGQMTDCSILWVRENNTYAYTTDQLL